MVDALVGIASAEASGGRVAPALELVLHLKESPGASGEAKRRAEQLRGELESRLTPDEIEVIRVRVRVKSFQAVVDEVLSQPVSAYQPGENSYQRPGTIG